VNTTITRLSGSWDSAAVLEAWTARSWRDGLLVSRLSALDRVFVHTRNTTYELVVVSPAAAEVMVRGGTFFPEFTRVRVAGSSLGGSFLKLHGIYVGFRLELALGQKSVVTSTVQRIAHASGRPDAQRPN
jgi:hypothetical protein